MLTRKPVAVEVAILLSVCVTSSTSSTSSWSGGLQSVQSGNYVMTTGHGITRAEL